jgi:hypothetical protein
MLTEKLAARRNRLLLLNAVAFVIWQAASFGPHLAGRRAAPAVITAGIVGFALWAGTLRLLLQPLGDDRTQAALNDELTQRHRQQALLAGYWTMLLCAAAATVLISFVPVSPAIALRTLVIVGVAVPIIRFVALERRLGGE